MAAIGQSAQESPATTRGILARLATVLIVASVCACSSIGPPTVERDRLDYGTAIGDSWKQQTLLNIVKLRYGDFPVFLEIAQVIAGYQLESTVSAGVNASNTSLENPAPSFLTFGGSLLGQGKYTDRPTLIYAPLTGTDFLKRLMTPIPPSAVLFMLQSGYAADIVFPLAVGSINGVSSGSKRNGDRPADPQFVRLIQLLREAQLANAIQVRIERAKDGPESTLIALPPTKDPELAAKSTEIRNILGLKSGLAEFRVYYGGTLGKDDEISITTRSMLQIMLELGAIVEVPASDVAAGNAAPGLVDTDSAEARASSILTIASGDTAPREAHVSVEYNGHWFWIANTDIRSKLIFGFVMLLFSISDTGPAGSAPVVTVSAN